MGFDVRRIKQFSILDGASRDFAVNGLEDIRVVTDGTISEGTKFFDPADRDRRLGFRAVAWHGPALAPGAAEGMPPGYWDEFLRHPPVVFLECTR